MASIAGAVEEGALYQPEYPAKGDAYKQYLSAIAGITDKTSLVPGSGPVTIDWGAATITIYPPVKLHESDNDNSLAIVLAYDEQRFLFPGDAEDDRMEELIGQIPKGPYALLKVPHHGKKHEATAPFLAHVQPENAIITCSDKNPPAKATLAALEQAGTIVYETRNGDILVTSDGKRLQVEQGGR